MKSNWDIRPIYDVIVKIPGSTFPDEWVIRGNHHDAWVNGAEDPISGQVAMMEEARALGELCQVGMETKAHHHLLRVGWRRARTARLDRMGREHMPTNFAQHAVAYINSATAMAAAISSMGGSHTLEKFSQRRRA